MALIYGGAEALRGLNENIAMNGSLSYDPKTGHNKGMSFTWRYGSIPRKKFSGLQLLKQESFKSVNLSAIQHKGVSFGRVAFINANVTNENDTLIIALTVAKDYRTSTVFQVIHLVRGNPPEIYQRYGSSFLH